MYYGYPLTYYVQSYFGLRNYKNLPTIDDISVFRDIATANRAPSRETHKRPPTAPTSKPIDPLLYRAPQSASRDGLGADLGCQSLSSGVDGLSGFEGMPNQWEPNDLPLGSSFTLSQCTEIPMSGVYRSFRGVAGDVVGGWMPSEPGPQLPSGPPIETQSFPTPLQWDSGVSLSDDALTTALWFQGSSLTAPTITSAPTLGQNPHSGSEHPTTTRASVLPPFHQLNMGPTLAVGLTSSTAASTRGSNERNGPVPDHHRETPLVSSQQEPSQNSLPVDLDSIGLVSGGSAACSFHPRSRYSI